MDIAGSGARGSMVCAVAALENDFVARKLEFCHHKTWTSLDWYPAKGVHYIVIIKLDTLAKMPLR